MFPSLCIGDNQGTVLEKSITYIFVTELGQKERDGTGRLQGLYFNLINVILPKYKRVESVESLC